MKTFDEAVAVFDFLVIEVKTSADMPAAIEEAKAKANEFGGRMRGLFADARRSEVVERMIEGHVVLIMEASSVEDDGETLDAALRTALFSLFINGLVIGMEMEKQEL